MSQLAYLILTGDHTLQLPPILTEGTTDRPSPPTSTHSHRRSSSRGSVRGFVRPEEPLAVSLTPPAGRVAHPSAARPLAVQTQQSVGRAEGGGKEGSSTESQSHMNVSNHDDSIVEPHTVNELGIEHRQ